MTDEEQELRQLALCATGREAPRTRWVVGEIDRLRQENAGLRAELNMASAEALDRAFAAYDSEVEKRAYREGYEQGHDDGVRSMVPS